MEDLIRRSLRRINIRGQDNNKVNCLIKVPDQPGLFLYAYLPAFAYEDIWHINLYLFFKLNREYSYGQSKSAATQPTQH